MLKFFLESDRTEIREHLIFFYFFQIRRKGKPVWGHWKGPEGAQIEWI